MFVAARVPPAPGAKTADLRSRLPFMAGITSGTALTVVLAGLAALYTSGALPGPPRNTAPVARPVNRPADDAATPPDLAEALADLGRGTPARRRVVALWLAGQPPEPQRRPEAARALAALLAEEDPGVRLACVQALGIWGTPESVLPLLALLAADPETRAPDNPLENEILTALGRLGDRRGLAALAGRLAYPAWRPQAERLLRDQGPDALAEVLPYANHPDPEVRDCARALVVGAGPDALVSQSLADLASSDVARGRVAADWLGDFGVIWGPERATVVRALETAASRRDAALTASALKALTRWAGNDHLPVLSRLLASPDAPTRHAVIERLGRLKDPQAVPLLVERLASTEDRAPAARALVALGPVAEKELKDPKYVEHPQAEVRQAVAGVLRSLGGTVPRAPSPGSPLGRALDDLKSTDARRRLEAARFINAATVNEAACAEVARALETALGDSDLNVAAHARDALPKWATKENAPALLELLKRGRRGTRGPLIAVLSDLKDARAIPALFECLRGTDDEQKAALEGLKSFGAAEVEKEAVAGLRRGEVLWRMWCCEILAEVGTRESLTALETAEREASAKGLIDVSRKARLAIKAIRARQ
jgi:HEAT repeat protein